MTAYDVLMEKALEAERLADLVSYKPDKDRFMAQAATLREEAERMRDLEA